MEGDRISVRRNWRDSACQVKRAPEADKQEAANVMGGITGLRTDALYDVATGEDVGERCSCRVGDLSWLYSFHLKEGVLLIRAPSESLSLRTSSKHICMVSFSL